MTPLLEKMIDDAVKALEGDRSEPDRCRTVTALVRAVVLTCSRVALLHEDDEYGHHEKIAKCIAATATDEPEKVLKWCFNCDRLRADSSDHPGVYMTKKCLETPCPTCETRRQVFGDP